MLRFGDIELLIYLFFAGAFAFAFEAVFFAGLALATTFFAGAFFAAVAIEASYLSE